MIERGSWQCPKPDHFSHTQVLLHDEVMYVAFADDSEINDLIRLLTDLRDNPEKQMLHVHLQHYRMCNGYPERSEASDGEIIFHSPRRIPGEWPWEDEEDDPG